MKNGAMRRMVLVLLFLLSCCSKPHEKIRIGLLPIPDALPLVVAEELGYFKKSNPRVELVLFNSASERDIAFQSGHIDCMLADHVVILLMNQFGIDTKALFSIVGKRKDGRARLAILSSPQDLGQKGLGIAPNCIVDYIADQLLCRNNLKDQKILQRKLIPNISLRLAMLLENQIAGAILTDPFIDYAIAKGAKILIEDQGLYQIAIAAKSNQVALNPSWFENLSSIYDSAVDRINENPEIFRHSLIALCRIKENCAANLEVPRFEYAHLPGVESIEAIQEWMKNRKLIRVD